MRFNESPRFGDSFTRRRLHGEVLTHRRCIRDLAGPSIHRMTLALETSAPHSRPTPPSPPLGAPPDSLLTVSTDSVRPGEGHAFWADLVCAHLVKAECIDVPDPSRFEGHIVQRRAGDVGVSHLRSHAQRVRRSPRQAAQADAEHVLVNIQRQGRSVLRQDGRETLLLPGDLGVYTSDRPYELAFDGAFEQTVLILPGEHLRALAPGFDRATARRLPGTSDAAALLQRAAEALHACTDPATQGHWAGAVTHLLAACIAELNGAGAHCALRPEFAAPHPETHLLGLSQRQFGVLKLLIEGRGNKDIMRELVLSESTVKTHLLAIYRRLGVNTRSQAVAAAARLRLSLHAR
jgi:DNA-binding CsgD family transcriptional regulator